MEKDHVELKRRSTVSDRIKQLNQQGENKETTKNNENNEKFSKNNKSILERFENMKNDHNNQKNEKMENLRKQKNDFNNIEEKPQTQNTNNNANAINERIQKLEKIKNDDAQKQRIHADVEKKVYKKNESIDAIAQKFEKKENNKLKKLNEQIVKEIYGNNNNEQNKLTFENKLHIFDRKINNYEKKEKINLNVGLKNKDLNSKYSIIIYDEKGKIIGKSDKLNERNFFNFDNNLILDYDFSKQQYIQLEITKIINENEKKLSKKKIYLFEFLKPENYIEKIQEFDKNEIISIGCNNKDDEDEEYIQLLFLNNNNNNNNNKENNDKKKENEKICYTIQKDDKIIFKSAFCEDTYIKESDKLPINLLKPEFEISFYDQNYEEKKIKIKVSDLKIGYPININLPCIKSLDLNIKSETKKIIPINKLLIKGLKFKLNIAIDFTSSNGYPTFTNSLHYCDGETINNYEKGIKTIFGILSHYTENDDCNVYGFGADVKNEFKKIFNINNKEDPNIKGIENIIEEYKKTVHSVSFSGPTYFAPIINEVNNQIKKNQNEKNYYILLIISDGAIHDVSETIDSIIESSKLPLSIIIIGVGDYINNDMKTLNRENGKIISSKKEELNKDIIQYVHFIDYDKQFDKLKDTVLKYIPQQISDYYSSKQNF